MGTLSVTTLTYKMEEVIELMIDRNIDIIGICETRLDGEGMKKIHNDFLLIYKRMNNERKYELAFNL